MAVARECAMDGFDCGKAGTSKMHTVILVRGACLFQQRRRQQGQFKERPAVFEPCAL